MIHIDWKSIYGMVGTGIGTIYSIATKEEIAFMLTCIVALTTILYNVIKIIKALKK